MFEERRNARLKKVYICSPYRANNNEELTRNIEYAKSLTRQAIEAGFAPITPHLYMPLCLDENNPKEWELGLKAGIELLKNCSFVIAGIRYGISEGMSGEIAEADAAGIEVMNADKLQYKLEDEVKQKIKEYARLHACNFCPGSRHHTCTSFSCKEPHEKARRYAETHIDSIKVPGM
jgi:hypothetical protein